MKGVYKINMIIFLSNLKLHTLINKIKIAWEYGVARNLTILGSPRIRFVLRRGGGGERTSMPCHWEYVGLV